jgi:hypothetical protein
LLEKEEYDKNFGLPGKGGYDTLSKELVNKAVKRVWSLLLGKNATLASNSNNETTLMESLNSVALNTHRFALPSVSFQNA